MKERGRALVNWAYAWLEENPVTGLLVSAGLSAIAVIAVVGLGIYSEHRFVGKSVCTRDPSSRACAKVREAVARAEPIRNPCIGYQRVTRMKGRACPKDYVGLRRGLRQKSSEGVVAGSGRSPSGQPPPGDEPGGKVGSKAPKGGHAAPHPHHPDSRKPPPPPTPSSEPAAAPSSPPPPSPGNSGETPAPDVGVKACVDLIVSACADAGAAKLQP